MEQAKARPEARLAAAMNPLAIIPLFVVTAIAEIAGCYLVFLWTRDERSPLLLLGAAVSLALFAWLLSFHPNAGRAYAAYGGVYVAAAVVWGWLVEKNPPDRWDLIGAAVCLIGMTIITFGPRP
jgi:small multidrug resistance family-3 protein